MEYPPISEREIERQMREYMSSLGVSPAPYESLIMDGELHRYDIEGERPNSQHGAYVIHTNGHPAGYVQDWKHGIKATWSYDDSELEPSRREYINSDEVRKKAEEGRRQKEELRRQKQHEASERSRILFEHTKEASSSHSYLQAKRIEPHGVHESEERLVIPLRDIEGNVKSLQWIDPDGTKRFQPDTSITGLFWSIGFDTVKADSESTILLGEGFATMAKVYELTELPSVAGIACGFLKPAAQSLWEKYSKSKIYVMADNDKGTEERRGYNPGIQSANELVKSGLADYVIAPEFPSDKNGTDWDDYALLFGDEECARVIASKLKEAPLESKREKYRLQAEQLGLLSYEKFETFCRPVKSPSWLIEDWLPSESLVMLFAASGSGKSFVSNELAYAVANPNITHWHGKKILTHGPVVYIAGEGQRGMRKRLAGLVYHSGAGTDGIEMAIIKESVMIDEKDVKAGLQRVMSNIGSIYPNPVLIFFDTLTANMAGDENKTADASMFVRSCSKLIQEFGCTVFPIHHTGLNPEMQNRARGSSVLKAAMDMEMKLVKNGHILTLEMTKSKDTELQPPLVLDMENIEVPGFYKATGEPDTTCVLELNEGMTEIFSGGSNEQEKPPKAERFAKDTYQEAVRKFGVLIEDSSRGREVVSVNVEEWRQVFYEMTSADNANTKRSQFNRARALLLEEKRLLFKLEMNEHEYYCLEPSGDAYESALILELRRKENSVA